MAGSAADNPCEKDLTETPLFAFFSFEGWRKAQDEDQSSVVRDPYRRPA